MYATKDLCHMSTGTLSMWQNGRDRQFILLQACESETWQNEHSVNPAFNATQ